MSGNNNLKATNQALQSDPATPAELTNEAARQNLQPDDLHDLFGSHTPGSDEEDPLAQLRNDPNYTALIRDLEYIATQARLLFQPAEEDPGDHVWIKIQKELASKPPDA